MDDMQFLGYVISALITIGAFIAVVMKVVQPINDLRVVIQKLNDYIEGMKKDDEKRDKQIEEHGKQINALDDRVGKLDNKVGSLETKVDMYHKS